MKRNKEEKKRGSVREETLARILNYGRHLSARHAGQRSRPADPSTLFLGRRIAAGADPAISNACAPRNNGEIEEQCLDLPA